jgi:multidrug efflux system membrane fusion protein
MARSSPRLNPRYLFELMVSKKRLAGVVVAGLVVLAGIWYWSQSKGASLSKSGSAEGAPVRTARADVRDAPHYVSSIGTVQAFNMVLVRARVDGEISRVVFREGQDVRRGDVLIELDRRPFEAQLRSAAAQRDKDQALLDNAKVDLGRYEFLLETNSAPQQVLDTARSLVHQLEAAVKADSAQIDAARLQVDYATIRAPIDGRTGARLIDVGNMVHPSDVTGLVMLTQIRPVSLSFALPQEVLPALRARQARGALPVQALAQGGSEILGEGELTLIDNQIDTSTGTIHCKATFPNPNEALWPGQFVTTRVLLETIPHAVLVPASAIQPGPDGAFVYVVENGVAKMRRVVAGPAIDGAVAILSGVSGGETVIVEGQFQLEPDARVTVK